MPLSIVAASARSLPIFISNSLVLTVYVVLMVVRAAEWAKLPYGRGS